MKHTTTLLFLAVAISTSASSVLADGMMVSAPEVYINETSQQAVIRYDDQTNTETISILPGFRGDAEEFAWILPMPGLPDVEEEDHELFRQMREFTRPEHHYRDGDWDGCSQYNRDYLVGVPEDGGVNIIESRLVGYYQTMTLSSDEAPALLDSLTQWGFLHENNIDQATELINSYVQQDWYFVTVKVDSASFANAFPDYNYYGYYGGYLAPLKFTFGSDEIIYPMRISAMSASESTQVDLYVVADHRTTFPGATTRYANRFTTEEINSIGGNYYSSVKSLLEDGDFLTHLRRDFRVQDMSEDIVIVAAENDEEYWMIYYSGMPWMTILLLGPAVLWAGYRKIFC